ncbi:MAG: DUF1206 domain-containing protein [Gemmatimonadota bacterium]
MATRADRQGAPGSSAGSDTSDELGDGIEVVARVGYAAKGVVYLVIGILAVQLALAGAGGETSSTRRALQRISEASFGQVALLLVTIGLAAHTLWRLFQAAMDPEAAQSSDGEKKRWLKRGFFLISAVAYGLLTYSGIEILTGLGGGGGGGDGASGGGSNAAWTAELMSMTFGVWLVGIVGAGVVIRGLMQFAKAYTQGFQDKMSSFDFGPKRRKWIIRVSRLGLTARGVVFGIIGSSIVYAALTHDPEEARGLEGALDMLISRPWLLGGLGVGLACYAVYQWVKARYRIIGV